jgi:hypothetical protein
VVGTYAVWALSILYVLQRVREDESWPSAALVMLAVGAVVAAVALPIQILIWREDPGHPLPRSRLTIVPLVLAALGIMIGAIGRRIAKHRVAPGGREARRGSSSEIP